MRIEAFEWIKELRSNIERCLEQEENLRSGAERMTTLLSSMPKKAPDAFSRVEEYTVKLVQFQTIRKQFEFELAAAQTKWGNFVIEIIGDKATRQIIYQRYIEGKSWHDIGAQTQYSTSQILRLNRKGLQILATYLSQLKTADREPK